MKKLTKLLLLALFCLLTMNPALAKEDGDQTGDKNKDDEEVNVPEDWNDPIQETNKYKELINVINEITKNNSCLDLMYARMDVFAYEIRYWETLAAVDTDAYTKLELTKTDLQLLRLKVAKQRSSLENIKGTYEICVEGNNTKFLQDKYNELKNRLHQAGYLVDTTDQTSITEDTADNKCTKADGIIETAKTKVANYKQTLQDKFSDGEIEDVYNATEILKMAQDNFAYAAELKNGITNDMSDVARMQNCMGIISESNAAMELIDYAKKYSNGKSEDKSNDVDQLDGKIKIYLDIIGDKKAYIATLTDVYTKTTASSKINELVDLLTETQILLADVKYDNEDKTVFEQIETNFQAMQDILESYDEIIDEAEIQMSNAQKKAKTAKVIANARINIKALNSDISKKDKIADTETENDIVQYIEQGAGYDAATAKNTAKGFKYEKEYDEALANAYTALTTAEVAEEILKEVK